MGSRSIAQVAPTSATIALNAYIFGYGGHSLVTPHVALKQLWWTDERIEAKVTRAFIVSKLRGQEREFLDRPLAFGEGLTDDTYLEWILEKAKRLFLTLAEIGVPDQIFGCIDDSWGDEDLPLSTEDVAGLNLSLEKDDTLNKRFYELQFTFLLRELGRGSHIDYGPNEHIPMEYVNSVSPAVAIQSWDRIHFPGRPDEIFMRRKFSLSEKEAGQDSREEFTRDVEKTKALAHTHIAPIWASYTSDNNAYVLFDFVGEHTLQTFIDHRTAAQWMRVPAAERPQRLFEWMHCLADALVLMHHRGYAHTAIRPSNIIIDQDNRIAFADVGTLRTFQRGKKPNKSEAYDYAAPESQFQTTLALPSSPPLSGNTTLGKLHKLTSNSGDSTPTLETKRSHDNSGFAPRTPPIATERFQRVGSSPYLPQHSMLFRKIAGGPPPAPSRFPIRPKTASSTVHSHDSMISNTPKVPPEQSDIFSLACIYLDIVTYMLKGKTTEFVKFRTSQPSKSKPPPTRPTRPTSSSASSSGGSSTSTTLTNPSTAANSNKADTSFHALSPAKLNQWLEHLEAESQKPQPHSRKLGSKSAKKPSPSAETFNSSDPASLIPKGVPLLLALIRQMLDPMPSVRPSARDIRDRLRQIVATSCGLAAAGEMCCAGGSAWEREQQKSHSHHNHHQHHHQRQDSEAQSAIRAADADLYEELERQDTLDTRGRTSGESLDFTTVPEHLHPRMFRHGQELHSPPRSRNGINGSGTGGFSETGGLMISHGGGMAYPIGRAVTVPRGERNGETEGGAFRDDLLLPYDSYEAAMAGGEKLTSFFETAPPPPSPPLSPREEVMPTTKKEKPSAWRKAFSRTS